MAPVALNSHAQSTRKFVLSNILRDHQVHFEHRLYDFTSSFPHSDLGLFRSIELTVRASLQDHFTPVARNSPPTASFSFLVVELA